MSSETHFEFYSFFLGADDGFWGREADELVQARLQGGDVGLRWCRDARGGGKGSVGAALGCEEVIGEEGRDHYR